MNSEKMALLLILQRSLFGEGFSEERQKALMGCSSLMGQKIAVSILSQAKNGQQPRVTIRSSLPSDKFLTPFLAFFFALENFQI